ncbi:MAG: FAD-dependent monooxygenase, partial [Anaerolineae bacterium]
MRVFIIGGGPAGLYAGLLLKKVDPSHDITVFERNPPGATYGWGVVFSDRTLASFREADYKSYAEITDSFVIWDAIDVHYRGERIRCGGHVFAGLRRTSLLNILQRRCAEMSVDIRFETQVTDLSEFADFDLLIGADGINSVVRETYAHVFKPGLQAGRAKYIWLGTHKPFDAFTFIFQENEHGLFQAHVYPFDGYTSTFIVECDEASWRRAGLDQAGEAASIAYCEDLFADQLGGHGLMSNKSRWINFVTVRNKAWRHENIVLLGDSAHTAHFSIGSGTKLAMEDAIALAKAFQRHDDVETALSDYELERRPRVEALQASAHESRTYFENVRRYLHLDPMQFTFHLLTRSGRLSYGNLRLRDPYYVDNVDRWFAATSPPDRGGLRGGGTVVAPPPMLTALRLREMTLPNRVALAAAPMYAATDGAPGEAHTDQLSRLALAGAALILTEPTAVSPEGRITPGCAGMYCPEHVEAWAQIVEAVHADSSARVAIQLN